MGEDPRDARAFRRRWILAVVALAVGTFLLLVLLESVVSS